MRLVEDPGRAGGGPGPGVRGMSVGLGLRRRASGGPAGQVHRAGEDDDRGQADEHGFPRNPRVGAEQVHAALHLR